MRHQEGTEGEVSHSPYHSSRGGDPTAVEWQELTPDSSKERERHGERAAWTGYEKATLSTLTLRRPKDS